MTSDMRLDKFVQDKFNLKSRTFAENLIIKGKVSVNGEIRTKPSFAVSESDDVSLRLDDEYASLGGDKLNKAIKTFSIDLSGKTCVDIGASNGGFTDCMLREGAKRVYAVDVAECALPEQLKADKRVVVRDRINARDITVADVDGTCDFVSIDVSFISLKLILKQCMALLNDDGEAVVLIKPQFELGHRAGKRGIVQNPKDRLKVINDVLAFTSSNGIFCVGLTTVPRNFENKNIEYLARFVKHADSHIIDEISLQKLNIL